MVRSLSEKTRGFTLIELLIVVAVIAILAAIAIPNFLEAQVRAKVSRVDSDLRSIATALEAYYVDANSYPPDGDDLQVFDPATDFDLRKRLSVLTTPIAYMTTIPVDPFHTNFVDLGGRVNVLFVGGSPYPYIYNTYGNHFGHELLGSTVANSGNPSNWTLTSLGPNQNFDSVVGYRVHYDPTNGTVSDGDIHRSGGDPI